MSDNVAIRVEHVSKDFVLPHERTQSIKSAFVNLLKGKRNKTTEKQHALRDISFEVKKGEFFGIVGRNGSGKSTLLKILAQIYQPTKGKVTVSGRLVPFIELGVGFNPELTGRDNVYLSGGLMGFSEKEIDAMYDDIVEFAELKDFMNQKLKNYSSGMQVRLAFSVAVRADAEVLLIDEVLAVGDADFQRKCYRYFKTLKRQKKTVIFVSHDMGAIREFCDRAMLIEDSQVLCIGGSSFVAGEYGELFLDSKKTGSKTSRNGINVSNRRGDGRARVTSCNIDMQGEYINIDVSLKAEQTVDTIVSGLHITSEDGVELTAMNNRMIGEKDLKSLGAEMEAVVTWKMLNVFNDGTYLVTVTFVDDEGRTIDWVVDIASFVVRRTNRSTTSILPPVKLRYKAK